MNRLLALLFAFVIYCPNVWAEPLPKPIPPYRLGQLEPSREDLLNRLQSLKIRVSTSPGSSQNLLDLAEVEGYLGDLDSAIKHARSAAVYAPSDWRIHVLLAKLFLLDRNALAARLQAERALDLIGKSGNRTLALCLQIPALIDLKDFSRADELSAKAFKKNPKDARLAFLRAWVLASLDKPQLAIETYREAIQLNPSLNESHYNLGLLLLAGNQPQAASSELKTFLNGSPDSMSAKMAEELISNLAHQD